MQNFEVQNRNDFVRFVESLRNDLLEGKPYWQNTTLESFLDRMAYWVDDCLPEYLEKEGATMPPDAFWRRFAEILDASAMYE